MRVIVFAVGKVFVHSCYNLLGALDNALFSAEYGKTREEVLYEHTISAHDAKLSWFNDKKNGGIN